MTTPATKLVSTRLNSPDDPPLSVRRDGRVLAALLIAIAGCLGLFLNKPVHMDDPVYIWVARQICTKWWDFYGGVINWYGTPMRTSEFMMNPPLISYYIATTGSILGWGERSLHATMLVPAVGATWAIYEFARRLCSSPGLASAIAVLSPVFIVSSTTIMTDVPMLCLWVSATVSWMEGVRQNRQTQLGAGAILILAAALTKYFAACLVPLLAVYAILAWHGPKRGLLWLLVPVFGLLAYQFYTHHLYSMGMIGGAMEYAASRRGSDPGAGRPRILTGLSFTGGCLATAVPAAWIVTSAAIRQHNRAWFSVAVGLFAAFIVGLLWFELPAIERFAAVDRIRASVLIQLLLFSVSGVAIIGLALGELRNWRDPDSFLLSLNVVGTFVFVVALNWTVSARTVLPMAPAVGVLVVRALGRLEKISTPSALRRWALTVALFLPLSLMVSRADERFAASARDTSELIRERSSKQGGTVWFQGHWGFQYYMQQWGAKSLDAASTVCLPGDIMIVPAENTNFFSVPAGAVQQIDAIEQWQPSFVSAFDVKTRAGFYSDASGPLPFAFGVGLPVRYDVFKVTHTIRYTKKGSTASR